MTIKDMTLDEYRNFRNEGADTIESPGMEGIDYGTDGWEARTRELYFRIQHGVEPAYCNNAASEKFFADNAHYYGLT